VDGRIVGVRVVEVRVLERRLVESRVVERRFMERGFVERRFLAGRLMERFVLEFWFMESFVVELWLMEGRVMELRRMGVTRHAVSRSGRLLAAAIGLALLGGAACAGPRADSSSVGRAKADPAVLRAAEAQPSSLLPLIVREASPRSDGAERLVEGLGGTVTHELSIIGAFSARVPASKLSSLLGSPDVLKVWGDGRVHMSHGTDQYDAALPNKAWQKAIRLDDARAAGYDGSGVTVAILDTGISPVPDLAGRISAAADFTSEGDGLDRYGHGTHLAGIIASNGTSSGSWTGVAPKAQLVSVKVAGADGSTDVSVVIAGLQWIVANRSQFNIKILNLSFGTDSNQAYAIDPLDYAVEQVWFSGIFVVVAAGNGGPSAATINKPADDPFVVSVGAADVKGSTDRSDDVVAPFSSLGPTQDAVSKPDVAAPGISIVSNRIVGSTVDLNHPLAAVDQNYMKGTGTSQATAVVSGVAALMYQARPSMTPNVAKATLMGSAGDALASQVGGGAGVVQAARAAGQVSTGKYLTKPANQIFVPSTGLGSLESSRGSFHVMVDQDGDGNPELLQGEVGFGWMAGSWSAGSWSEASWTAGSWRAGSWSAGSWSSGSWSAGSWRAGSWSASSWSSGSWRASSWSSGSWRAGSWSSDAWS
jgi:serine protease AprX